MEVRSQKSEVRSRKSEVRSQKSEVRSRKSEVRSRKSEVGSQKSEVRSRKSEVRSRKSEVGSRKSEVGSRKSEVGSRKSEVGSRKSEVGSQKSEVRSQKSEVKIVIMNFKFEKLIIWQKAMDYGENIFLLSRKFPKYELYNLTSQIRRAVDSIALNISEGSIGQSNLEFKRFIGIAIRSLAEVVTCLHKAHRRNYISTEEFNEHYDTAFNLMNMLVAFKDKIK